MKPDFQVERGANDNWVVLSQGGSPVLGFRRRMVAEAFGKALAHQAKVSLVVHRRSGRVMSFSGDELTYSPRLV